MARSPLRFWAGEWDTWPVSLSLSASNENFHILKCSIFIVIPI